MNRALELIDRYWKWVAVAAWLGFCAYFLVERWTVIRYFWLPDTDDNLRIAQVRALLSGQDWFDLRQYKLNPPAGADIHWSRLVDLPLAGLILLFRPLLGGADAERVAVAVAPLLPLLLLFVSLGLTVRRLVDPRAYPLAFAVFFFAGSATNMFMPARIDHHGWQLALLALAVAAVSDPKRARGGATLGVATALSLSIGLELMIYLALAGGAMALFWVADRGERRRLAAYAASLGGGTALGFLLFASNANRLAVCDALSPVWLSDALLASALLVGLAMLSPAGWRARLALALGAGLAVAAFHALAWPHCLSRPEGVSAEVERLWLSNVREARPLYRHGWRVAMLVSVLPVTGILGWAVLAWFRRQDPGALRRTLGAGIPCLVATSLLLWQTRTGPAAQVLAIPGAVAILWLVVPIAARSKRFLVTTLGTAALVVLGFGAGASLVDRLVPREPKPKRFAAVDKAARDCTSLWGLRPVARQPKGVVFTFVDLGPRLIAVTHHSAIAGPYHRNGDQIADVMKAFRGDPAQARAIIARHRADYVLICPNMATATIFMAEARNGFYADLAAGRAPGWLEPVDLGKDSPFRMWRVKR